MRVAMRNLLWRKPSGMVLARFNAGIAEASQSPASYVSMTKLSRRSGTAGLFVNGSGLILLSRLVDTVPAYRGLVPGWGAGRSWI